MTYLQRAFSWIERQTSRVSTLFDWRPKYKTVVVNDYLPKQLERLTLYLVRDDGYFEQAALICPCGCKQTLHMNLLPDERPQWRVFVHDDGTVTLHPSIWRQKDCRSHFWFRQGQIVWAKNH